MTTANPFPGMNPYLQQRWGSVHTRLITYAGDALQTELPGELRAHIQERVFVESSEEVRRSFFPDVHAYEYPSPRPRRGGGSGGATAVAEPPSAAAPIIIHIPPTVRTERYIEIIDVRSGGRVITIIEFLSPTNKNPGQARELYREKQAEAQDAGVNLVEVDLILGGEHVTLVPTEAIAPENRTPYHACVFRAEKPQDLEYYPISPRNPMPEVRIPLRPHDADVVLRLQELINLCHERGRYDDIDYRRPAGPIGHEDARWIEELLKEKKLR